MPPPMALNGLDDTSERHQNTGTPDDIQDGNDVPDGIFKPGRKGRYEPRVEEMESWGSSVDSLAAKADDERYLLALLRADPIYRWRYGLVELLRKCEDGVQCHKALVFLYAIVVEGVKARERGVGETVDFNHSDAPHQFSCADWLNIIDGLNFVTTSPGTVRDISYVDVETGANTDQSVLKGFCCLLKSLGSISWTNVQDVLTLDEHSGLHLYYTITQLQNGYSLEHDSQKLLETLHEKCPEMLADLGFIFIEGGKNTWKRPKNIDILQHIKTVLYSLFTSADRIETPI